MRERSLLPYVKTRELFAAYESRFSGAPTRVSQVGKRDTSDPVSIKKAKPDLESLTWRRFDVASPNPTVSLQEGEVSFSTTSWLAKSTA